MSISDLFDSGFQKRNQDHFAAIVRVAMGDGVISKEEKAFLDRLAHRLNIEPAEYAEILGDYKSHPINPPHSLEQRYERLYDLAQIVNADEIQDEHEVNLMGKIAIGLGFDTNQIGEIVPKALKMAKESADAESFVVAMQES